MTYEQLFMALSFLGVFILGAFIGGLIASYWGIYLKISKKEDYEQKVKELDRMMDEWNSRVNEMEDTEEEPLNKKIRPFELFPEDLQRDFGLPRELK